MTTQITMSDLVSSLRKAAANPEAHAEAQRYYFSPVQENSVLVHSGTACGIAAYLFMQAHEGLSDEEIDEILHCVSPDEWVAKELGLSKVEYTLALDPNTHHEVHALLADIMEGGLRLRDLGRVKISSYYTYNSLDWACRVNGGKYIRLEAFKDWMRANAK
jgi:hypothetical protein